MKLRRQNATKEASHEKQQSSIAGGDAASGQNRHGAGGQSTPLKKERMQRLR